MKMPDPMKQRLTGSVWALAWMWPLIQPATAIAQGRVHPALGATLGLAAFVVLYLIVVTNGFDASRPKATRADIVMLCGVAAIGIALVNRFGDGPAGWLNIPLYVAVCGAALLGPSLAVGWVIGSCGIFAGYVFNTRPPGGAGDVAQTIFGMLLASMLVHTMKQMLRYIRILHVTRAELARTAVSAERLRFARDLHDLLGHTMSVIVVKAEVVRRLVEREPATAARAAADIEEIGRNALAQVRQAVDGYRGVEFSVELDNVRAALGDAGIAVRVEQSGPPLSGGTGNLFGWVIREAATNVIRHSGAQTCEILVEVDGATARVEVRDDGVGLDALARSTRVPGVGLIGLSERVAAVGGTLTSGDRPGGGFRLVATAPVSPEEATPGDEAVANPVKAALSAADTQVAR